MKLQVRMLVAGPIVLALGFFWLASDGRSRADDKGDERDAVQRLADALKSGDKAEAKKLAEDLAKEDLEPIMNLMGKRLATQGKKKVFGVGSKAGTIQPDGIEAKIIALSKRPMAKPQLEKEAAALAEMGYRTAAIGEVAKAKPPEKDEGKKKKKDWETWSEDMIKGGLDLAKAASSKNPQEVKNASAKLSSSCNNCHGVFRDSE